MAGKKKSGKLSVEYRRKRSMRREDYSEIPEDILYDIPEELRDEILDTDMNRQAPPAEEPEDDDEEMPDDVREALRREIDAREREERELAAAEKRSEAAKRVGITKEFSREEILKQLRRQTAEADREMSDKGYWKRVHQMRRDRFRERLCFAVLGLAILLGALFCYRNHSYSTYALDQETQLGALSGATVHVFGDGVLIVGTDTVTCLENGTIVSTTEVSLHDPVTVVEGDYFAVCDRDGYQVHIGDSSGIISTVKVSRRVRCMDISASGVLAVFTESNDAAYISYFDRYGSRLSVEVKTVLEASGQPVDIAVSPDGQKLLVLFYSTANGVGGSRLVLYDFEHGREDDDYVALEMEDFYETDTLLLDGEFFDDTNFVAIGDNEALFMSHDSVTGDSEPVVLPLDENVQSVMAECGMFGYVEKTEDGAECVLLDRNGREKSRFAVDSVYDKIRMNSSQIMFLNDAKLTFYNLSGRKRYEGTLVSAPEDAVIIGGRRIFISTGNLLERITLK